MKKFFLKINFIKILLKQLLFFKVILRIFFNYIFKSFFIQSNFPKIFYAGAIRGNLGGPKVKTKKLSNFFPESKFNFNIVYVISNYPFLFSNSIALVKRQKIPIILNQNGVFYPAWSKKDWQQQNVNLARVYHSADYIFWQSTFCKTASDKFLGKRIGEGEILYNAVDTKRFLPKREKSKKIFKLLFTGNINRQNNYRLHIVLKSLKEIVKIKKDVHLYVAGYLYDLSFFKNEIEKLDIKDYVSFLGPYSQENAVKIYQNADAYITVSYQDNCPSAVIEAMSCGLPILYSSSGGVPELVGENSGIGLEVPQDWEEIHLPEISKIVSGFFKILEKRQDFSEHARERAVQLFDISYWIERHNKIFKKFLNK